MTYGGEIFRYIGLTETAASLDEAVLLELADPTFEGFKRLVVSQPIRRGSR
jgi:hypothetical protein